jgi:hypothetical protein
LYHFHQLQDPYFHHHHHQDHLLHPLMDLFHLEQEHNYFFLHLHLQHKLLDLLKLKLLHQLPPTPAGKAPILEVAAPPPDPIETAGLAAYHFLQDYLVVEQQVVYFLN